MPLRVAPRKKTCRRVMDRSVDRECERSRQLDEDIHQHHYRSLVLPSDVRRGDIVSAAGWTELVHVYIGDRNADLDL